MRGALLFAAAFQAALVSAQDDDEAVPCISKPDHSNYGKNGDVWCMWDEDHFWKPTGVGCQSDAECQSLRFPYTNCHAIASDALLANGGIMFCRYDDGNSGPTECGLGVAAPPNRPNKDAPGSMSGKTVDFFSFCRDVLSRSGLTGINVVAGCNPAGTSSDDVQCIYQCNGSSDCGNPHAPPKAYHKLSPSFPSCPGFETAN
ncbi:hypothetical protein CERZMDRAFT_103554 [Cercospora zeae-maydis SCOH1-5]|uniref:Uncharacterized protein n=1 Tax=Cercospora zeae-maydis SCOH1-5 TaxID=717836 RepID=A0A6A6EX51_9PEZI|nr:hypothetical protein CERZMDRAFT_103554 [Cercospora zeae-maydis SCOH1-5]